MKIPFQDDQAYRDKFCLQNSKAKTKKNKVQVMHTCERNKETISTQINKHMFQGHRLNKVNMQKSTVLLYTIQK